MITFSVLNCGLSIDYLAYTLIVEAQTEAQNKTGAQNAPQHTQGGL